MAATLNLAQVRSFGNVEFLARQLVEGFITGLHKSPFHGFSVEFAEHRLYNPGESTRYIDWKVFGKTDKLFVKRYEEETNLRCHLLIDTSSSMYYPEKDYGKITFSAMGAASLAYMLQRQRDAVSLCTFADEIELQTPVKSTPGHVHKLFTHLDQLLQSPKPNRRTSAPEVIHQLAEKINKRSLVILFSDMFDSAGTDPARQDALFSALQHLRHNLHEVLIFHVTDRQTEQAFAFDERPYEFIDLETGNRVKLQPNQVRDAYKTAVTNYLHNLKLRCAQYRIDFIEADIAQGFEPILSAYLVKRTKMR
ncbi:DUF58 domain-containing protein [Fibrella sp. HMF5335]|uniref:DUF58 domain-containing protein n=1 Tax=Fibrella rubiginis TaxID=2817060 RepID=A0A939GAA3_9BACT|nr:DUF58 domain-containing protein [Fibrella rubiginis]MBO0935179.1 DUF58 domain-containing protein [Fibrella rubiginis]